MPRGQGVQDFRGEAERRAREWLASADPSTGVGSKHHTVPAFYLKRFASESKQLSVRDRSTGALSTRSYLDMTIKDFYTFVNADGALDGRLEQMLCQIEGNAARVFGDLLSPFRRSVSLDTVDYGAARRPGGSSPGSGVTAGFRRLPGCRACRTPAAPAR